MVMSWLAVDEVSSMPCSGAEKKKRFRESECLNVKRRRGRVFEWIRNESARPLLRMIEDQSLDTDWNLMMDLAGSLESISKMSSGGMFFGGFWS